MITNHQKFTESFAVFGFLLTLFFNSILIYLTVFHVTSITGLYKKMIVSFSLLGIMVDSCQMIAKPFLHNYKNSFLYFSMNEHPIFTPRFLTQALGVYAGLVAMTISVTALQFALRHLIINNSKIVKQFTIFLAIGFAFYTFICGSVYGGSLYFLCQPDNFTIEFWWLETTKVYNAIPSKMPSLVLMTYDANGGIRWENYFALATLFAIVLVQYAIILYCGIRMRLNLKKKLDNTSFYHRLLEQQFFKALVVQITLPSVFLMLTLLPVLIFPFLNLNISFQTGIIYIPFSFYSPLDSIAFMWIMSEYEKRVRELLGQMIGNSLEPEFNFPANYVETVM